MEDDDLSKLVLMGCKSLRLGDTGVYRSSLK